MSQSHLTKVGGLKTAGFLMLVEGSGIGSLKEWRETRNEAVLKVENSCEPVLNQRIDEMYDEDLDFFLARFVAEVRNGDGQEYPAKTNYEMICGL